MASQLKYVIMATEDGIEFPIIFASVLSHKGMAEYVSHLYRREMGEHTKPVSAGFCYNRPDTCFGESESLKMKSRGIVDDEVILLWG